MMATTHALAGLLLASVTVVVAPEHAPAALLAGFAGGVAPDLDMPFVHRRTLHFPVYLPLATVPMVLVAALVPTGATVALAAFVGAAALHSVSDVVGGSLEHRPWEATVERAVYSHYHGRWLAPRRWVGYDGAPADLVVAGLLGLPALALTAGHLHSLVVASLLVSIGYTAVRRRLPAIDEDPVGTLVPGRLQPLLPDRYR